MKIILKKQNKRILIYSAIALLSIFMFLWVVEDVKDNGFWAKYNQQVNYLMNEHHTRSLMIFALVLDYLFNPIFITFISFAIFGYFEFIKKDKKHARFFALVMTLNGLAVWILKMIMDQQRPDNALRPGIHDFSFPSGHTAVAVVFLGMMLYLSLNNFDSRKKKIAIFSASLALIFIVALSRLYLNVHWVSDVIGGFFLGSFILFLPIIIFEILSHKRFKIDKKRIFFWR